MNLYFLVEGSSVETRVYPQWLARLVPELKRVPFYDEVARNNYFLISGEGYPSILHNHLRNAIEEINETEAYDFLVVCLDTEEKRPRDRIDEVRRAYQSQREKLRQRCVLKIIVQNHCIETWFLGNRAAYPHHASEEFSEYASFYNVARRDPEFMKAYDGFRTRAAFHYKYLQAMLRERDLPYTKQRPDVVGAAAYLEALVERAYAPEGHLRTLRQFFEFCQTVRARIQAETRPT